MLESSIGLRDTCSVHNLNGMPGLLARLSAALVSLTWYGRYTGVMPAGTVKLGIRCFRYQSPWAWQMAGGFGGNRIW